MISEINYTPVRKKIVVKVLEELKSFPNPFLLADVDLEWHDSFGINTPYRVSYV